MKTKVIVFSVFLLAAAFFFPKTVMAADEPDPWAAPYIARGIERGIISPELRSEYVKSITRLDFCTTIVNMVESVTGGRIENIITVKQNVFNDTNHRSVNAAFAMNIVLGTGNGNFSPHTYMTRQEAAVMIANTAKALDLWQNPDGARYDDDYLIAGWAQVSVDFVTFANIMGGVGDSLFDPTGIYTKQQAFTTAVRAFDYFAAFGDQDEQAVTVGDTRISLGMTGGEIKAAMGNPAETMLTIHGHTWHVYISDYNNFALVGIEKRNSVDIVTCIATNAKNFDYNGITNGYDLKKASDSYKKAVFLKDTLSQPGRALVDGVILYDDSFFYNIADFEKGGETFLKTMGRESYYFTNAYRVKNGLKPFSYSERAERAASLHSGDQAKNETLTNVGSDGSTTPTRLNNAGIQCLEWGENVESGQYNGIFAYESIVNAIKSRETVLADYAYAGCGAALSAQREIYYTQDFYTPIG